MTSHGTWFVLLWLALVSNGIQAAETPSELRAIRSSGIASGLVVVVGARDTALAEALTADGHMAVDLLAAISPIEADEWRARLASERRAGLVSVVPLKSLAALPYGNRFANIVVADLDAIGDAAPPDDELRRVVATYGALCLHQGGEWRVEKIGLAPDLDEWTHFEHGADGNPLSTDEQVGHVRGLQWASYDVQTNPGSTPRIGGGAHVRAISIAGGGPQRTALLAREAGNGLLRWRIDEAAGQRWKRSEVFEKSWCIADGRIHGLVGDEAKWAQSIDLATGKTAVVYDQGIPAPIVPDKLLAQRQIEEERRWKSDVTAHGDTNTRGPYSLGLPHIALDGMIIQGGNVNADGEPITIPLGPSQLDDRRRRRGEPLGPTDVTQAAAYHGRVVALSPADGKRLWSWEAPAGLQVAELIGSEKSLVVGLTPTTIGLGVHYRNRFIRLAEVVVLDAQSGRLRWRSDHVKNFVLHHLAIVDGGLYAADHHVYAHEGDLRRMVRFDLASGKIDFDKTPDIDNTGDNWKNRFAIFDGRVHLGGNRHLVDFDGGLYVWQLDAASGEILGRTVVTSGFSNVAPLDKAPALDLEGRSNDIPSFDRTGRALHVRDIAIDTRTWNWLNVCAFLDLKLDEAAGFRRTDLAALFSRPLENHNAFYQPSTIRFGGGGLSIKFNMTHLAWYAGSHDIEGSDMAIGPDRAVVITRGSSLTAYDLDERGLPRSTPRPNAGAARNLNAGVVLTTDYRPRSAVAMTRDRIVLAQPATQNKPASLLLFALATRDGVLHAEQLAAAPLPADPLAANLAIAGQHIVVCTSDGVLHRFATNE